MLVWSVRFCAWVKFRNADDAVKDKVLKMPNVGSGHVKSNISAKLVALIKDKISDVQAPCVAFLHVGLCFVVLGGDR